jgi:hypothetical protein
MTLILTQLSDAGIAMATDSKISYPNGKPFTRGKYWRKLFKVPRLKAAISYWGSIGLIAPHPVRFDEWFDKRIKPGTYADLRSFADYLADEMNKAVGGKPLIDDQGTGIHVAGFQQWPDGARRPTFYHIHNGHGHIVLNQEFITVNGQKLITKTSLAPVNSPRELFSRHDDFSPENPNHAELLAHLSNGYMTINGDYGKPSIILGGLKCIFDTLNTIEGVSVPKNPNALGARVGLLKNYIEITISIYKCSSMRPIIGGEVLQTA